MIKIAHASISEQGTINGKAGDQTGGEVCIRDWYDKGWKVVLRPTDPVVAEGIVTAAKQIAQNDHIGYGQSDRTGLYKQAVNVNFDIPSIKTACNCDCSSMVAVCCIAAGLKVSKDMYTGNEESLLLQTGKFTALRESKYLTGPEYLRKGDILLKPNSHTAVVIEDGAKTNTNNDLLVDHQTAGEFKTTIWSNVRTGPSYTYESLVIVEPSTRLICAGQYGIDDRGVRWAKVYFSSLGKWAEGFISEKLIKRVW